LDTAARQDLDLSKAIALVHHKIRTGLYGPSALLRPSAELLRPFGFAHFTQYLESTHTGFTVCMLEDQSNCGEDVPEEEYNNNILSIQAYHNNHDHHAAVESIIQTVMRLLNIDSRPHTIQYLRSEPGAPAQVYHIEGNLTNINCLIYLTEGHRVTELLTNRGESLYTNAHVGDCYFFLSNMLHRGPMNDSLTDRLILFMSWGPQDTSGAPIFVRNAAKD
jgi:hypothetical protein